jgi:hypothetical protein
MISGSRTESWASAGCLFTGGAWVFGGEAEDRSAPELPTARDRIHGVLELRPPARGSSKDRKALIVFRA